MSPFYSLAVKRLCLDRVLHLSYPTNYNSEIPTDARTLTHPAMLIASTNYFITVTINFPELMRPQVPDLKVENVNGGHWLQLERADEVNRILEEFMKEK